MSKKKKALIGTVVVVLLALGLFFVGQKYGLKQCKPCPQPVVQKEVIEKQQPRVEKRQIVKRAVVPPVVQAVAVPNYAAPKLVLRLNVVEWSPVFQGKRLKSREIGPIIDQGLANGTVVRTKETLTFLVNNASVLVRDGSAIVDPGPIGPETVMVVQPANGMRFASPPNGLPLTTNPGELNAVVRQGMSEIWMCFILAPR